MPKITSLYVYVLNFEGMSIQELTFLRTLKAAKF